MKKNLFVTMLVLLAPIAAIVAHEMGNISPSPVINCDFNEGAAIIYAIGEGEIHLYCDGVEVENPCEVPYAYEEQYMFFTATAQIEGMEISCVAEQEVWIPAMEMEQTSCPNIDVNTISSGDGLYPQSVEEAIVEIIHEDPEADIYYFVSISNDYYYGISPSIDDDGWTLYVDPLHFTDTAYYAIYAYAVAPGKAPSGVCGTEFSIINNKKTVRPLVYAHHVDAEKGLALRIVDCVIGENPYGSDYLNNVYVDYYMDVDDHWAPAHGEEFFYQVNDAEEWTQSSEFIYLKEYGDYTISAYASNTDARNSDVVKATVRYEPTGYTSQSEYIMVSDGIVYYIQEDSTLRIAPTFFSGFYFINYPIVTPVRYVGDVNIPPVIYSQGRDYTVTSIGVNGVSGNVTIPSTVIDIDASYFSASWELNSVSVDENNPVFDSRDHCNAVVRTADNRLLIGCANTVIPATIETIGDFAFYLTGVSKVDIPDLVDSIGACAFEGCNKLTDAMIGNSVKYIGERAFFWCENLSRVTIGESVDTIGDFAFDGCDSLKSVICKASTPPALGSVFYTFGTYNSATLFVPAESLEAYRAHQQWGQFYRIVPFLGAGPGDVNGDGKLSIGDVTGLIDVLLASGEMPAYCDVNGDGKVSIADVTALIEMLLKSEQ